MGTTVVLLCLADLPKAFFEKKRQKKGVAAAGLLTRRRKAGCGVVGMGAVLKIGAKVHFFFCMRRRNRTFTLRNFAHNPIKH
jgi:hypothetical protein